MPRANRIINPPCSYEVATRRSFFRFILQTDEWKVYKGSPS